MFEIGGAMPGVNLSALLFSAKHRIRVFALGLNLRHTPGVYGPQVYHGEVLTLLP